jgi:valyl-tRNA synthetase
LYYCKYFIKGEDNVFLTVATTRPETIFVDACLFINPKDKRYIKYLNKTAINPINGNLMPILADEYVDIAFGTGVMKCTPAHDFNDYKLAQKHKIKNYLGVINADGTMNSHAKTNDKSFEHMERFIARDAIGQ